MNVELNSDIDNIAPTNNLQPLLEAVDISHNFDYPLFKNIMSQYISKVTLNSNSWKQWMWKINTTQISYQHF
jgi:hypothetical protein